MNKKTIILTITLLFFCLPSPSPLFAQDGLSQKDLIVTSHIITINQIMEGDVSHCDINEEITFENKSLKTYQGQLTFFVGANAQDVTIIGFRDEEKQSKIRLETSPVQEGLIAAALDKETFIKPKSANTIGLVYSIFPVEEGGFIWQKQILHQYAPESLQIKINPIENMNFRPKAKGFALAKSEREQGWHISPMLSPKTGAVYSLTLTKEGEEEPMFPEEQKWYQAYLKKVDDWILDNSILAFLANNAFILFIVFVLPWLAKRIKLPKIKIKITRKGEK